MAPAWKVEHFLDSRDGDVIQEFLSSAGLRGSELAQYERRVAYLEQAGTQLLSQRGHILEKIEDGLYALRLANTANNPRFLLTFRSGRRIVVLHACKKKDRRLNAGDIRVARGRLKELEAREGSVYGGSPLDRPGAGSRRKAAAESTRGRRRGRSR